jgi:putative membrane protein
MKTVILLVTLAVFAFRSVNHSSDSSLEKSSDTFTAINEFAATGNYEREIMQDTTSFILKAIKSNQEEIMMSQIALQKSSNQEIKALAQKLMNDHLQLLQQLQGLNGNVQDAQNNADSNNMNKPQMQAYNNLNGMSFDRKWISDMIIGHQKAINDFRNESVRTNNAQLKTLITNALPTMQEHLRQLEALRSKIM